MCETNSPTCWWERGRLGQLQDLDHFQRNLCSTQKSWRGLSGHKFVTSSSRALGLCGRTIKNTAAVRSQRVCGLIKVQTGCGMTRSRPFDVWGSERDTLSWHSLHKSLKKTQPVKHVYSYSILDSVSLCSFNQSFWNQNFRIQTFTWCLPQKLAQLSPCRKTQFL